MREALPVADLVVTRFLLSALVAATGFVGLLAGQPAAAKTSRATSVSTPVGWCMVRFGGGLGCNSPAVPSPFGTDGYLWMRERGQVHRAETGGLIGPVNGRQVKLRPGDRWVKRGIRCRVIRGGIKCQNRSAHGFRLRTHSYRMW